MPSSINKGHPEPTSIWGRGRPSLSGKVTLEPKEFGQNPQPLQDLLSSLQKHISLSSQLLPIVWGSTVKVFNTICLSKNADEETINLFNKHRPHWGRVTGISHRVVCQKHWNESSGEGAEAPCFENHLKSGRVSPVQGRTTGVLPDVGGHVGDCWGLRFTRPAFEKSTCLLGTLSVAQELAEQIEKVCCGVDRP